MVKKEKVVKEVIPQSLDEQLAQLDEAERRAKALFMETGDRQAIPMIQQIEQHKLALQHQKTEMDYEIQLAERNKKITEERQRLFEQLGYNPNNQNMDRAMVEFTNQRPPIAMSMPMSPQDPTIPGPVPTTNPKTVLPAYVQQGQPVPTLPISKENFRKRFVANYMKYLNLVVPVAVFLLAISVIYLLLKG